MRKGIIALLIFGLCTSALAQEPPATGRRPARRGEAAGYSNHDATVLSMMGWGLGLAAGFAALCALIDNDSGGGGGGGSGHSH
ncbi:MAG TPA: hypothetical protein VLE89_05675 [Chlamydiales bacterium]|nr:hypothetical protein [Chlamydiales bacterium]